MGEVDFAVQVNPDTGRVRIEFTSRDEDEAEAVPCELSLECAETMKADLEEAIKMLRQHKALMKGGE